MIRKFQQPPTTVRNQSLNCRSGLLAIALAVLYCGGCERDNGANDNNTTGDDTYGSSPTSRGLTPALGGDSLKSGRRVAIVIGNDVYENLPEDAQLAVAVSDARKMAQTLRDVEPPFAVTLLENARQNDSENALEDFVRDARDAECALVYFAGHGVEYHGSNFLLTSDTKLDPKRLSSDVRRMKRIMGNEAIDLQALVDDLEATRAGVKVVILDACRDNPLEVAASGGNAGGGGQRSVLGGKDGGLAQVSAPSGMLIAYSADASQQANDGLFTEVLCRNIQRPGIDIVRVFAATREEVLRESRRLNAEEPQRWVVHEPAEYNKLNEAGTRFRFAGGLSEVERKLAELEKQLAEEKLRVVEASRGRLEKLQTKKEADPPSTGDRLPIAAASNSKAPSLAPDILVVTDGLLARFGFDEIAATHPQTNGTTVSSWPKRNGIEAIGSLRAQGVDTASGSTVRKIVASPEMFPALKDAHCLVQVTGGATLEAQWNRQGEDFGVGDQLTCVVVFWTPEKNATLIRLHPPMANEAEISAGIINSELISNIALGDREYPVTPFAQGNLFLVAGMVWTGPQDSSLQSVMTADGSRYDSTVAAAPNLSLLISSLTIGGETGPLKENVPSGIYIAELLLYDRALTKQERAQVDSYLNQKYFR